MQKINVPGDSYRAHKELIIPAPSLMDRLKLWWINLNVGLVIITAAIIVLPIFFLSGIIHKELMVSRLNKAAISYLERVHYTNITIVHSEYKHYTAGTGCLSMNRELSAKANYVDGKQAEILLCCNEDTFNCAIEKTYIEK